MPLILHLADIPEFKSDLHREFQESQNHRDPVS